MALGWASAGRWGAGIIFGVALSVASTVVLLRVLQERRLVETERGRITVGWLIVQDIAMVLVLVLLPGLAALFHGVETAPEQVRSRARSAILLGKFAIFLAVMFIVGKKLIPAILHYVAHTGSRELFRLAVLAIAHRRRLCRGRAVRHLARSRRLFCRHDAERIAIEPAGGEESLPLRDAFAVLFFVSVGMLFGPTIVVEAPFALLGTVFIIVIGKSVVGLLSSCACSAIRARRR